MTAYIVGMITGAICVLTPLLYLMSVQESVPPGLLWGVFIVGAVVFLLSAFMAAYLGGEQRGLFRRGKGVEEEPGTAASEPEAAGESEEGEIEMPQM